MLITFVGEGPVLVTFVGEGPVLVTFVGEGPVLVTLVGEGPVLITFVGEGPGQRHVAEASGSVVHLEGEVGDHAPCAPSPTPDGPEQRGVVAVIGGAV